MTTYLLLNIGIISIPFILSFEKKLKFYKNILSILISILIVSSIYIIWDIYATASGHWNFNSSHSGIIYLLNLPLEEVLFFITVPYSMLFLYEVFNFYLGKNITQTFSFRIPGLILFISCVISSFIYIDQAYTFLAFSACALFFLLSLFIPGDVNKSAYWIFILISYIPFFIVNYILTAIPVVTYNPASIWGIRFTTIPLEDFFYSFSMISFYLLVYTYAKRYFNRRSSK